MLTRAGLPIDLFQREGATITAGEYFALWNVAEQLADDPMFPLKAGVRPVEGFHPLFFAILNCAHMQAAMEQIQRYKRLVGPVLLQTEHTARGLAVSLFQLSDLLALPASLVAMDLVYIVNVCRIATRHEIRPIMVTTTSDLVCGNAYADFFGVMPVRGTRDMLLFSSLDARRSFVTENPSMWKVFEPELQRRLSTLHATSSATERVRALILELLPSGRCSMDKVAERLQLNRRTLQRQLAREHTSFQDELKRQREKLARHYLNRTDLPDEEIAFLLGFEDPGSFTRAFRIWTGQSPGKVRLGARP